MVIAAALFGFTVALLLMVALYEGIVVHQRVQFALDHDDAKTDAAPQPPPYPFPPPFAPRRSTAIEVLLAGQMETQRELLKLVQVLAVRSAEAEKAVAAVATMGDTPLVVAEIESAPVNNQELNWAELPRDHARKQMDSLAEALAGIKTPDGGELVDP